MVYFLWKLLLLLKQRLMLLWLISHCHQEEKNQKANQAGPLHTGRVHAVGPECSAACQCSAIPLKVCLFGSVSISWFINSEAAWLDGFSCTEQKRVQEIYFISRGVRGRRHETYRFV